MKAIETRYKGYRFRSRLEARWAVYFDAEGIEWDYEREGFRLPSGSYLPDFWLPQVSMWAEVKPKEFSPHELRLCQDLADASGHSVLLLDGQPEVRSYFSAEPGEKSIHMDFLVSNYKNYHNDEQRFYCSTGSAVWPEPARGLDASGVNLSSVEAARSARFEHGESGAPAQKEPPKRRELSYPESRIILRMNRIDALFPGADNAEKDRLIYEKADLLKQLQEFRRGIWKGLT